MGCPVFFVLFSQDTLSLWDLHFLVMIYCWPDLTIQNFELTTECGSASKVMYVLIIYLIIYYGGKYAETCLTLTPPAYITGKTRAT